METRIGRKRPIRSGFGSCTGSRIAQNRRSRVSEGYGSGENPLEHSLGEEPGDPEANRDGRRVPGSSRPLRDCRTRGMRFCCQGRPTWSLPQEPGTAVPSPSPVRGPRRFALVSQPLFKTRADALRLSTRVRTPGDPPSERGSDSAAPVATRRAYPQVCGILRGRGHPRGSRGLTQGAGVAYFRT